MKFYLGESFGSPVADFGIPKSCELNCDIDFNDENGNQIRLFDVKLAKNIEFALNNDLHSYIITKSGAVHLLNKENLDG